MNLIDSFGILSISGLESNVNTELENCDVSNLLIDKNARKNVIKNIFNKLYNNSYDNNSIIRNFRESAVKYCVKKYTYIRKTEALSKCLSFRYKTEFKEFFRSAYIYKLIKDINNKNYNGKDEFIRKIKSLRESLYLIQNKIESTINFIEFLDDLLNKFESEGNNLENKYSINDCPQFLSFAYETSNTIKTNHKICVEAYELAQFLCEEEVDFIEKETFDAFNIFREIILKKPSVENTPNYKTSRILVKKFNQSINNGEAYYSTFFQEYDNYTNRKSIYKSILFENLVNELKQDQNRVSRLLAQTTSEYEYLHMVIARRKIRDKKEIPIAIRAKLDRTFLTHASSYVSEGIKINGETLTTMDGVMNLYLMYNALIESCEEYFQQKGESNLLDKKQQNEIINAIKSSCEPRSHQPIITSIKKGKLTIIQTGLSSSIFGGTTGHAISIGFFGDKMFIGNTGDGIFNPDTDTFQMFTIDPECITPQLITYLMNLRYVYSEYGKEFIYDKLLKEVNAEPIIHPSGKKFMPIPIGDQLITTCLPSQKNTGTCVLGSLKASFLFGMTVEAFNNPECSLAYLKEYRSMMLYHGLRTFINYCEDYYDESTGSPKEGMEDLAVTREVLKTCWKNLCQPEELICEIDEWMHDELMIFLEKYQSLGLTQIPRKAIEEPLFLELFN